MKVKHMNDKLDTGSIKIKNLDKQTTEKDSELKSIIEVLYSYTPLSTGHLEWKINGVRQKIENREIIFTDPFYVGTEAVYIHIMKGGYDDKLHRPIRYKYTLILLNHTNSNNNYEYTKQITKEDLNYPNSFKKPTQLRNEGLGTYLFISKTEILEAKYCKEVSITLLIKMELLPAL
ncbi:hypothetical protein LOD99_10809 [Oopsacas minuta]|uniref:TRAF1-6 MATH domain-containing protein n=1 Tax=Oopsacas minuta TaxID=111878 RepID=A0AAV7KEA6_9METZ|nr:hypothetical protein LOD99_10809 [Oopsacas minuta]